MFIGVKALLLSIVAVAMWMTVSSGTATAQNGAVGRTNPAANVGAASARIETVRTGSPRETMATFLRLASQMETRLAGYAERKSDFTARRVSDIVTLFQEIIDLSKVSPASRRDVATDTLAFLMDIFGRITPVALEKVPDAEAFPDDAPTASWRIPNTPLRIVRILEGDQQGQFVFGPRTPDLAETFFARVEQLPLRLETELPVRSWTRTFPQWTGPMIPSGAALAMPEVLRDSVFDTPIWKIILVGIVTLSLAIAISLAHWLVARNLIRHASPFAMLFRSITPVLVLGACAWMGPFLQFQVSPSGDFAAMTKVALTVIAYVAWVWLVWLLVRALFAWIVQVRGFPVESFDAHLCHLIGTALASMISIIILGDGATQLGLPIFSVLAGIGIGGLAVALAIRPTLENLIGGIILYVDQPVRVGDFCSFGDKKGTIESIGIRSTRIRAMDRTVITVPNATLADMELINYARCDRMLIQTTLGLRYETTADEARFVLVKIREMLHSHPKIDSETIRVRFVGYGNSSLDIAVRIYALTNDWNEYFAVQEDALLRMKDIVENAGSGFAFPSQTLYIARDEGLDEEIGAASEAEVNRWRKNGQLPFPRLARERVDALEGTLDYPPRGSVEAYGQEEGWDEKAERLSAEPEEEAVDELRKNEPEKA